MRIGPYSVDTFRGNVPAWKKDITVTDRAGTDGYTFVKRGLRSAQFQVVTKSFQSSMSAARQRADDYQRLCGSFVTLEDASGREFSRIMVLDCVPDVRPLLASTSGDDAMVETTWTLIRGG